MTGTFRVEGIDHVELLVSNRQRAIDWYGEVFGLEMLDEFVRWVDTNGPVVLSSDDGETKLAVFEVEEDAARRSDESTGSRFRRVAFGVSGDGFLTFLDRCDELELFDDDGALLEELQVVDHELAFSTYFCDPFGNRLELTTYDYDQIADRSKMTQFRTDWQSN